MDKAQLIISLLLLTSTARATIPSGCAAGNTVCQSGACDYRTLSSAISALPTNLTGLTCVNIMDTNVYNLTSAITISTRAAQNNYRLTIQTDPSLLPSVASITFHSGEAFLVKCPSVTIQNLAFQPDGAVSYELYITSYYFIANNIVVLDTANFLSAAGVEFASLLNAPGNYSTISNSTISLSNASESIPALYYAGNGEKGNVLTNSSVTASGTTAIAVDYGSGNSFYASNDSIFGGTGMVVPQNSTITNSTITSVGTTSSYYGVNLSGAGSLLTGNKISNTANGARGVYASGANLTITNNSITSKTGNALDLEGNSDVVTNNTINCASDCLYLNSSVTGHLISSVTVTGGATSNPTLLLQGGYNTLNYSTISAASASSGISIYILGNNNVIDNVYSQGTIALEVNSATGATVTNFTGYGNSTTNGNAPLVGYTGSTTVYISNSKFVQQNSAGYAALWYTGISSAITISSTIFQGGKYGLYIGTQAFANYQGLSITSATFTGLTAGATAIVFSSGTYNLTLSSVQFNETSGTNIDAHNLVSSTITMTAPGGGWSGATYCNDATGYGVSTYVIWPSVGPTYTQCPLAIYPGGATQRLSCTTYSAADAALKFYANGTYYETVTVSTSDANASALHLNLGAGAQAARKYP